MSLMTAEDRTLTMIEIIFPEDTNAYGTAFGGRILSLMDKTAGLVASKWARTAFVTASLDSMEFRSPIEEGEIIELVGKVIYTSKHTAGVRVDVYGLTKFAWERRFCSRGFFLMVAIGPDGKVQQIPQFQPEGQKEEEAWQHAKQIHEEMLARRKKSA